jgi:hypothetical protein
MGGSIAVAIRFSNGEAVCFERWTNTMSAWFLNERWLQEDRTYILEYVSAVKNNWDPKTKTWDGYGKPLPLRRSGYGIVIWDFLTHHVIEENDYTSFNRIHSISLANSIEDGAQERVEGIKSLADAGRLFKNEIIYDTRSKNHKKHSAPSTWYEILQDYQDYEASNYESKRQTSVMYDIDVSPFTYVDLEKDKSKSLNQWLVDLEWPRTQKQGLNKFYKNLIANNFQF